MDFKSYCNGLAGIVSKQLTANFKLGDWLRDGEEDFGKRVYAAAARATGLPVSSLRRMAEVSKRVPRNARNKKLSWGHHRLIQSLSPERQRELLKEAEPLLTEEYSSTLPVYRFREKIGFRFPGTFKLKNAGPHRRFCFSIPEDQFATLQKLADAKATTLTDYIQKIVAQHVSSPWAEAALLDAKAAKEMQSSENRRKGRLRWEETTRRSIEDLIESVCGVGSMDEEPADFVRTWRRCNGGKPFPLAFAMKHTSFGHYYRGLTAGDFPCGKFEPVDEEDFQSYTDEMLA
jgi:hypothetical protein